MGMRKTQWQLISERKTKRNRKRKIERVAVVDITNTRVAETDLERVDIDQVEMKTDTDQVVDVRDRPRKGLVETIDTVAADIALVLLILVLAPLLVVVQDHPAVAIKHCTEIKAMYTETTLVTSYRGCIIQVGSKRFFFILFKKNNCLTTWTIHA